MCRMLWIGVQSGTTPGHAKILKSGVKSGKGGRDRRRAGPQSICDSGFVPITCGRNGRGPAFGRRSTQREFVKRLGGEPPLLITAADVEG